MYVSRHVLSYYNSVCTSNLLQFLLDNLTLANEAKFDVTLSLPGSLWNNYLVWSTTLETNFPADECSGFCYFHDPDPSECSFAVSDSENGICYMGAFDSGTGGLQTGISICIFRFITMHLYNKIHFQEV